MPTSSKKQPTKPSLREKLARFNKQNYLAARIIASDPAYQGLMREWAGIWVARYGNLHPQNIDFNA